jgi:hypothetical protein
MLEFPLKVMFPSVRTPAPDPEMAGLLDDWIRAFPMDDAAEELMVMAGEAPVT